MGTPVTGLVRILETPVAFLQKALQFRISVLQFCVRGLDVVCGLLAWPVIRKTNQKRRDVVRSNDPCGPPVRQLLRRRDQMLRALASRLRKTFFAEGFQRCDDGLAVGGAVRAIGNRPFARESVRGCAATRRAASRRARRHALHRSARRRLVEPDIVRTRRGRSCGRRRAR